MNDQNHAVRLRHAELDHEIETIRRERLIRAASPAAPGLPARARAGIGRGLISLGTSLVGRSDAGSPVAASTNGARR